MRSGNFWKYGFTVNGSKSDFALRSKTKGLKQTRPNLDRDRSGPFSGTDGLNSVRSTDLRSVFGLPYAHGLHCKHHTQMTMNKFHFNELKRDTWKCDWLIGYIISIDFAQL